MSDDESMFEIEGATLSLADIAGINMDDVSENRGGAFPGGIYDFEVGDCPLTEIGKDKKYPAVDFHAKVLDAVKLDDESVDKAGLIGSDYQETFIIGNAKNFGSVKAMAIDSGVDATGKKFVEMLEAWKGCRIRVRIKNKPNKNDSDFIEARIQRGKIVPLAALANQAA